MRRIVSTLILAPDELSRAGLFGILAGDRYRPTEAKGGWEAAASYSKALPAIVILILNRPMTDAAVVTMIEAMAKRSKVVVLAGQCDADLIRAAVGAGALACLPRSVSSSVLLQTLDLVVEGEGEVIFPASLAPAVLGWAELELGSNQADRSDSEKPAHKLSSREIDILKQLVRGDSNKQIGRQLNISEPTVKVHVKAILRKVRLSNRTQAAIWGLENLPDQVSTASALQASDRVASEATLVPRSVPPTAPNAKLKRRGALLSLQSPKPGA
jgi:two-component system nitrate/nitrite response regulator NarL